jgi:hypothetical protein
MNTHSSVDTLLSKLNHLIIVNEKLETEIISGIYSKPNAKDNLKTLECKSPEDLRRILDLNQPKVIKDLDLLESKYKNPKHWILELLINSSKSIKSIVVTGLIMFVLGFLFPPLIFLFVIGIVGIIVSKFFIINVKLEYGNLINEYKRNYYEIALLGNEIIKKNSSHISQELKHIYMTNAEGLKIKNLETLPLYIKTYLLDKEVSSGNLEAIKMASKTSDLPVKFYKSKSLAFKTNTIVLD